MVVLKILNDDGKPDPVKRIVEGTDPVSAAETRRHLKAFGRNLKWLQGQWGDFLPAAKGRCIVVGNQQGAIVDGVAEAEAWLAANHPDDIAPVIKYISPLEGPRIYAHQG